MAEGGHRANRAADRARAAAIDPPGRRNLFQTDRKHDDTSATTHSKAYQANGAEW